MNQASRSSATETLGFSVVGGHQIVECKLGEGECICISQKHLLAFTGKVTLGTAWTTQVSSLALGRMFYATASGPGVLLIEASGQPHLIQSRDEVASFPMSRLTAWSIHTEFRIVGFHGWLNILFDDMHLKVVDSTCVVLDADSETAASGHTLTEIFRRIYMPD